ncbi:MAG: ferredoxin reductase [Actinomycetota bacterium]|nr:ferredoxin reductase [Actinomycetota bacterium]
MATANLAPAAGPSASGRTGRLLWTVARVRSVQAETPRASRLVLEVPGWAGHLPGQHLDVRLSAPNGYQAQRSYSIASAPEQSHVELIVETLPDGEVSPYLTGELRAGDDLEVRGPVGGWFVWHTALGGPLQLIAGGSGVVPFLAMLEHRRATGSSVTARLLYSARTLTDVIATDRLDATGAAVTLVLTRQAPADWGGPTGRVDAQLLREHVLPPDAAPQVFVCGPTGFVEAVASVLTELGHPPGRVKTERFGDSGGAP